MAILSWRPLALWLLGYPEAARADLDRVLMDAREIGQAATLMYTLTNANITRICYRDHAAADAQLSEAVALADEKGAALWKAFGMILRGCVLTLTGKASDAIQTLSPSIIAARSTGSTVLIPFSLPYLAKAQAELRQFDDARHSIDEAIAAVETTNERWCEADICRMAGEISLMFPQPDAAKAEAYFERALSVARKQQAQSWELRAAMSMARLWRDQGKRKEARQLLAPVYGWFTEGFDTLDLKEAKQLLDELS